MRFGPYPDNRPLPPRNPDLYRTGRFITTRYRGGCVRCCRRIPAGARALYSPGTHLLFCTRCYPEQPQQEVLPDSPPGG